jgi:hypothetical protein
MLKKDTLRPAFISAMAVLYLIAFFTDLDIFFNDRAAKAGLTIIKKFEFGGPLKYLTFIDMVC